MEKHTLIDCMELLGAAIDGLWFYIVAKAK